MSRCHRLQEEGGGYEDMSISFLPLPRLLLITPTFYYINYPSSEPQLHDLTNTLTALALWPSHFAACRNIKCELWGQTLGIKLKNNSEYYITELIRVEPCTRARIEGWLLNFRIHVSIVHIYWRRYLYRNIQSKCSFYLFMQTNGLKLLHHVVIAKLYLSRTRLFLEEYCQEIETGEKLACLCA